MGIGIGAGLALLTCIGSRFLELDGTLVRTLRSLLRNELPFILPKTRRVNSAIMDDLMNQPVKPRISTIVRACVARINA